MSRNPTPVLLAALAMAGCTEDPTQPKEATFGSGSICDRGAAYEAQCNDNPDAVDLATCEDALDTCSPEEVDAIDTFLTCLESEGCDGGMRCFSLFPSVSDTCAQALDGGATPTTPSGSGIWMPVVDDNIGSSDLLDIHFVDTTVGWTVGSRGLLHTSDGGLTWNEVDGDLPSDGYQALDFMDRNTGWVAGDSDSIYRTDDGGLSWTAIEIPDELYHRGFDVWQSPGNLSEVVAIDVVDANTVWVLLFMGTVLVTNDAGITWELAHSTGIDGDLQALDADTYWAIGGTSLTGSTDGGETATYVSGTPKDTVHFVDPTHGWVAGTDWDANLGFGTPSIHGSTDGVSFVEQFADPTTRGSFQDIHFVSQTTGWAVGNGNGLPIIVRTTDGGTTWTPDDVPSFYDPVTMNAITAVDESHAWAVGDDGTLLRFTR